MPARGIPAQYAALVDPGDADVSTPMMLPIALRLQLKRLVGRRNTAVVRHRKLTKPSGAKKSDQLEQLISEQLGEIDRFNAQIAEVQSSKMVAGRSKDRIRPCDGTGGLP